MSSLYAKLITSQDISLFSCSLDFQIASVNLLFGGYWEKLSSRRHISAYEIYS